MADQPVHDSSLADQPVPACDADKAGPRQDSGVAVDTIPGREAADTQVPQHAVPPTLHGTSLSGSLSTILTVLCWICAGIYMCGVLPSPACA